MKVTVTMEFESMEAAAAFFMPPPIVINTEAPRHPVDPANPPVAPLGLTPAEPKPTKKRAANKPADPTANAPKPAEPVVEAVKHTLEHVQAALESVFSKHGLATARGLLSRFGVQRAKDLKPEQYTAFVTDAGKVVETGKV